MKPLLAMDPRSISVGTTSTQILGPNPRRWGLLIGSPLTNRVTLSPRLAAVLDNGITLYPTNAPLYLTFGHIGESIREDIYAIAVTAAQTIGVWDIFFG